MPNVLMLVGAAHLGSIQIAEASSGQVESNMQDGHSLTSNQIALVRELIEQAPQSLGLAELTDVDIGQAFDALAGRIESSWKEAPPEMVAPRREGVLGMVLVRKRRQLAYSLKLSNLTRDPLASVPAVAVSVVGGSALPALMAVPPATFPSFVLGIALAWVRAFAHPIGYGEASLLHYMNQIAAIKGKVSREDLADAGRILVEEYGYVKGQNSNEISALVASLISWSAIEEFDGGYRVAESVPIGLGPLEYAS